MSIISSCISWGLFGTSSALQSLGQDNLLRCDLDHLGDVQSGDTKGLSEAELAVGFGVGVIGGSEGHVFAVKHPHAIDALDAGSVEGHLRDDDGALGIDLVFANWASLLI